MKKVLIGVAAVAAAGAVAGCTPVAGSTTPVAVAGKAASASPDMNGGKPADDSSMGGMSMGGAGEGTTTSAKMSVQPNAYTFTKIDDQADPTFNQLLGINTSGVIAGYFGSGAAGHPNRGYRTTVNGTSFTDENVPNSVQTQVTGINDQGVTVGFSSTMNNANLSNDNTGFYNLNGSFHSVVGPVPLSAQSNPPVGQVLGVNDTDTAVGFYTDSAGATHGYKYDIARGSYSAVTLPASAGAAATTAAAIDNEGDVAGFFTNGGGTTQGFLLGRNGGFTPLAFQGASMTQALGVNDRGEVVGVYQVGTGDNAQTHGFTWTRMGGFMTVDDPNGVGATTVNGVNDLGDLVGFYTDGAGNTHGMLAKPAHGKKVWHLNLAATPAGSVTLGQTGGQLSALIKANGLTPGSSPTAEIDGPSGSTPIALGTLTVDGSGNINQTLTANAALPTDATFVVRLGTVGAAANSALAAEPIAHAPAVLGTETLVAQDVNASGQNFGTPHGVATVVYDAGAQTLTVTVNATGLTPGAHAAHIHAGSCQQQGGVLYMLTDFQANATGQVIDQTRTVTGVAGLPANGMWYLNLHLGSGNAQGDPTFILTPGGTPSQYFRPLACANS